MSERLQQEIARRADLIGRLKIISGIRFIVLGMGPVRAQVPLAQALDHVPTEVLARLDSQLVALADEALSAIVRLDGVEIAQWRLGDTVEEVREERDVTKVGLTDAREYRLKRASSQVLDGARAADVRGKTTQFDSVAHGEVGQMSDHDLKVLGAAVVAGSGHDVVPGSAAAEVQP